MVTKYLNDKNTRTMCFILLGSFLLMNIVFEPAFAVTIDKLQEPIRELKKEIFGGWMFAVKIIAASIGIILSTVRGSLAPFGIGAALSAGIHFMDKWLGDGAAGALI